MKESTGRNVVNLQNSYEQIRNSSVISVVKGTVIIIKKHENGPKMVALGILMVITCLDNAAKGGGGGSLNA